VNFFTHLECGYCGTTQNADQTWNLCPECHKPLLARYDLEAARREFSRKKLAGRPASLWRYAEMLPIRDEKFRLGSKIGNVRDPLALEEIIRLSGHLGGVIPDCQGIVFSKISSRGSNS